MTVHSDHSPRKAQELFAYLLIHCRQSHSREELAELLWAGRNAGRSRKYLRQALWQLHEGLMAFGGARAWREFHNEPNWVRLEIDSAVRVDAIILEVTFNALRGTRGAALDLCTAQDAMAAIQLYAGDILEGWYTEWCLNERTRFRGMYLALLDKLIEYHEARKEYEICIALATLALQRDGARERAHRSLMRSLYLSGDRTGALRQYERCVKALKEELDVQPDRETVALRDSIIHG